MTRCPYCHDAVDALGRVCAGCLARHHPDCWEEGGCCASCAGEQALVAEADPARRRRQWRWLCLLAAVPTGVFAALTAWVWWFVFSVYVGKGFDELGAYAGLALSLPVVIACVSLPLVLLRLAFKGEALIARTQTDSPSAARRPRLGLGRDDAKRGKPRSRVPA